MANFPEFEGNYQDHINQLVQQYEMMRSNQSTTYWDVDDYLDISDHYEQLGDFPKALETINYALHQHPYSGALYTRKAQLHSDLEEFDQATIQIELAQIYEPNSVDVLLTKAEILHHTEYCEDALQVLQQARLYAEEDDMEDILLLEATIFDTIGNYESAFDCLLTLLRENTRNELAAVRLRICLEQMDITETILPLLQQLVDDDPYSEWAWALLAYIQGRLEKTEEALESFDYALVINEQFAFARYDCIEVLMNTQSYNQALEHLKVCSELFGNDADTYCRMGECYAGLGDLATAFDYFKNALNIDSLRGRVHYQMANCYLQKEQWTEALQAFEMAHQAESDNSDYCLGLAETHAALFHQAQAHEYYQQAIAHTTEDVRYWWAYLRFLTKEAMYSTALNIIDTAQEHLQEKELLYAQAAILFESGARQDAFVWLMQALLHNPNAHNSLYDLVPDLEEDIQIRDFIEAHLNFSKPKPSR